MYDNYIDTHVIIQNRNNLITISLVIISKILAKYSCSTAESEVEVP